MAGIHSSTALIILDWSPNIDPLSIQSGSQTESRPLVIIGGGVKVDDTGDDSTTIGWNGALQRNVPLFRLLHRGPFQFMYCKKLNSDTHGYDNGGCSPQLRRK